MVQMETLWGEFYCTGIVSPAQWPIARQRRRGDAGVAGDLAPIKRIAEIAMSFVDFGDTLNDNLADPGMPLPDAVKVRVRALRCCLRASSVRSFVSVTHTRLPGWAGRSVDGRAREAERPNGVLAAN